MSNAMENRSYLLEQVFDMMFDEIEKAPEVMDLRAQLRALATDEAGRDLMDAGMNYATFLARRAFLAGLAFDARAVLLQAVAELNAA
ncbi:MAG: hypothetical protein WA040_02570 [Anaerolineae bacterium]